LSASLPASSVFLATMVFLKVVAARWAKPPPTPVPPK
jgi:hypothetical protein